MKKKKPMPLVSRERIIESIYHIVYMGNTSRSLHNALLSVADKINEDEKLVIRYSIQSNVMLDTISLLDEINKYLFNYESTVEQPIKAKIESYKYIIEPVLNEINKWTSFRKFRNNILAHNFRNDKDDFKSVFFGKELHDYIIPNSTMDLLTLFQFTNQITKIAEELFKHEYEEALNIVERFKTVQKEVNQSAEEETNRINQKLIEVNQRIRDYNSSL